MANVHAGSWGVGNFKLPDFGFTEKIGSMMNKPVTSQGGSNIIGNNPVQKPKPMSNASPAKQTGSVAGASTSNKTSSYSSNTANQSTQPQPEQTQSYGGYQLDDYSSQIDGMFNDQYGYLDKAEQNLTNDLPTFLQEAENAFKTNKGMLDNSRAQGMRTLDEQGAQADQRNMSAMGNIRRLYDELGRGATQRFGGSTSAGEAAREIQGQERLRQTGETQRQFNDVKTQLGGQMKKLDEDYQTGLLQLEQSKQAAINQAQRDFQQKLLEITNNRTQVSTAKAQAKLGALQDLRNKVFAINQQNTQFQQSLEQQRIANQMQMENYAKQLAMSNQNAQSAVSGLQTDGFMSNFGISGQGQPTQQAPQYIGKIGKSVVGKDEMGRTMYDDGTRGWTNWSQ